MTSNMSVLGLYTYDNTLFANMNYPDGFDSDDETNLVNNLLCELAEMEVLYTSPAFMKTIIGVWSYKEKPTWDRIFTAAQMEYNPIENYDRQELSTVTSGNSRQHSGTDTRSTSGTDTKTNSGTDTTTNSGTDTTTNSGKDTTQNSGSDATANTGTDATTHGGTDTTTNKVAGFDSNTLVDHDSSAVAHGHTESLLHGHTATTTFGRKEELTHGHVEALQHGHVESLLHGHVEALQHGLSESTLHGEKIVDEGQTTNSSRIHGNIGVTTSQQMLEQELEVAPKLNIMNIIIESFKNRFCLLVY